MRTAALMLNRLIPDDTVVHSFDDGKQFMTRLHEPYWAGLLVGWEYEPEVGSVIERAVNHRPDAVLIDAGANLGYWSVKFAGRLPVIAIEAVPTTYSRLHAHGELNSFGTIHRALWNTEGHEIAIAWNPELNEAASITCGTGSDTAQVTTTTLDRVCEPYADRPIIVKLDVEGAETEAVQGAGSILTRALFVYEDHGRDHQHQASKAMIASGLALYDPVACAEIALTDLPRIKTDRDRGYNFVALHPDGLWRDSMSS